MNRETFLWFRGFVSVLLTLSSVFAAVAAAIFMAQFTEVETLRGPFAIYAAGSVSRWPLTLPPNVLEILAVLTSVAMGGAGCLRGIEWQMGRGVRDEPGQPPVLPVLSRAVLFTAPVVRPVMRGALVGLGVGLPVVWLGLGPMLGAVGTAIEIFGVASLAGLLVLAPAWAAMHRAETDRGVVHLLAEQPDPRLSQYLWANPALPPPPLPGGNPSW